MRWQLPVQPSPPAARAGLRSPFRSAERPADGGLTEVWSCNPGAPAGSLRLQLCTAFNLRSSFSQPGGSPNPPAPPFLAAAAGRAGMPRRWSWTRQQQRCHCSVSGAKALLCAAVGSDEIFGAALFSSATRHPHQPYLFMCSPGLWGRACRAAQLRLTGIGDEGLAERCGRTPAAHSRARLPHLRSC